MPGRQVNPKEPFLPDRRAVIGVLASGGERGLGLVLAVIEAVRTCARSARSGPDWRCLLAGGGWCDE
jgi:hypothetical protein